MTVTTDDVLHFYNLDADTRLDIGFLPVRALRTFGKDPLKYIDLKSNTFYLSLFHKTAAGSQLDVLAEFPSKASAEAFCDLLNALSVDAIQGFVDNFCAKLPR